MAEANHRLPQIATAAQARITTAAHVLAQFRSRQLVKEQLQRRGVKVSHLATREITALASEYLREHRTELMPDAIETIDVDQCSVILLYGFRKNIPKSIMMLPSEMDGLKNVTPDWLLQMGNAPFV